MTTADEDRLYGLTVSAYLPVSRDPPRVLVSLARLARSSRSSRSSRTYQRIRESGSYAVNILGAEREALARHFVSKDPPDKTFVEIPWRPGVTGAPLFDGALAAIECRVTTEYPGGDHVLLLGAVVGWEGSVAALALK